MKKYIQALIILITLQGCSEEKKQPKNQPEVINDTLASKTNSPPKPTVYKNIDEVVKENDIIYWISEMYYPALHFSWAKDTLIIEYDGQCQYSYPIKVEQDKIVVYWDFIENCTHHIGIKKSFGLKKVPKIGTPFMTLRLTTGKTLDAEYLYPEWTARFNKENKNYFYLPPRFTVIDR